MSFPLLLGDNTPAPTFDSQFLSGVLPSGLTYTNSSTTRTYFGSDGLLKTAAANAPIFEYNPVTLALLGMRWEMEQRTNLLVQSTLPGGGAAPTSWTRPGGTGTSAPAASIYGNADGAVAYLHTAVAQRPVLDQVVALSANTTYTHSVLIESVTAGIAANNAITFTNTPAGAIQTFPVCQANPSGGSTGIITTGVLIVTLAVSGTAGSVNMRIGLGATSGVTGTMQFSRPQLEVGASRSSFIPTAAAAVTRQPDVLTASSIPWYRQDEGTVVFEGISSVTDAVNRGYYVFSDGTTPNRILSTKSTLNSSSQLVIAAGVGGLNQQLSSITSNSAFRSVLAYKLNDSNSAVNGTLGTPDTSVSIPSVTQLRMGCTTHAGVEPFMGYARRFQYFNTRLPNTQIQGMSRV